MSWLLDVGASAGVARLVASESKARKRPSVLTAGLKALRLASAPAVDTLARLVTQAPLRQSRTKTSQPLAPSAVPKLVSPSTRLEASDQKATTLPSPLMVGSTLPSAGLLPGVPLVLTLARVTPPPARSFT